MDSLIRLGDHGLDAEQVGPLRRPVTGRAHSVVLARQHEQRRASRTVMLTGLENRRDLTGREVGRPATLGSRRQQVPNPNVPKGAPSHHKIIPSP